MVDMDAHLEVDKALIEEDENEEERRFNEIIYYDSGDSSEGIEHSDMHELQNVENVIPNSLQNVNDTHVDTNRKNRSNAEYLENERIRNYKRKYGSRIQAAQQKAQELGVPYITLPPVVPRGRKIKFGTDSNCTLVIPAKFENGTDDEWDYLDSSDMPIMPLEVELKEMDEVDAERQPNASTGNENKLSQPPSLLLKDLDERERQDMDRIREIKRRSKKNKNDNDIYEFNKRQQMYKRFVAEEMKRRKQTAKSLAKPSNHLYDDNCVEHEDLDDLFEELAKVANKELPEKKDSHRNHLPRKEKRVQDDVRFSLTVSMPVQPTALKDRNFGGPKLARDRFSSGRSDQPRGIIWINDSPERSFDDKNDNSLCNEDSIEIKHEPIYSDDEIF